MTGLTKGRTPTELPSNRAEIDAPLSNQRANRRHFATFELNRKLYAQCDEGDKGSFRPHSLAGDWNASRRRVSNASRYVDRGPPGEAIVEES
jgi:hypothetical protein